MTVFIIAVSYTHLDVYKRQDYGIYIRNITFEEGKIISTAKDEKAASVYEMYYSYEEPVKKAAGHRILALNRGEKEKMCIRDSALPVREKVQQAVF